MFLYNTGLRIPKQGCLKTNIILIYFSYINPFCINPNQVDTLDEVHSTSSVTAAIPSEPPFSSNCFWYPQILDENLCWPACHKGST